MRIIKLLVILLTASVSLTFAQNFEGKITYKNDFKSKVPNVTSEQFNAMMGTTQEYFTKGGNYKSVTNGTFVQWQLYINKDNKLYNKWSNSATLYWNDCSVNSDTVIKSELNKGVITILGHQCDELILTCKSGVQKYYFSSVLKTDSKLYEQHKFGNWNEFVSRTNTWPLKMSIDNEKFSVESIATEITPIKLDDKLFELPLDSKTEKSPFY